MTMHTRQVAGVLGVALLFGWKITNAVDVSVPVPGSGDTFDFDIPTLPLRSATQAFAKGIGHDTYISHGTFEPCGNFHGVFGHLTWPVVTPERNMKGVHELTALAGVRRDDFSDGDAVTRTHLGLRWAPSERWLIEANVAQQYRPSSLFELNLPTIAVPAQIYDPERTEAVSAVIYSGGNHGLQPTTGKTNNIQAKYYVAADGLAASLNYFSIRLRDRIAVLPVPVVLAHEAQLADRVGRQAPNAEDLAADRPGRITFVNTTRDNVGRL